MWTKADFVCLFSSFFFLFFFICAMTHLIDPLYRVVHKLHSLRAQISTKLFWMLPYINAQNSASSDWNTVIIFASKGVENLVHCNELEIWNFIILQRALFSGIGSHVSLPSLQSAPQSKNIVRAFQITCYLLSFTLKDSWRNWQTTNALQ